ncbi:flagellar basal body M-ring protein FliF [Sinimarinibacterium sp. CAU 1509]|uniref:flagellar basal-body MS-ring/collar protein FliF n=1 Tax=Sinimarinibacterium sp. CAU 1509 TaxID=2562283 RepID=UPI0010AD613D|nr:flagellar basal-body MS-ring/collar protein FliF [Sinimarinibacterium sp. CAU 1509]TJY62854.1 flagellar basal body M-ring protein FliF [Sinimarinibacterium sp. CAU 1509]
MANTAVVKSNVSQIKDHPALRQLLLLVGIAGAVAAGLWLFRWSQDPAYVPLFNGLSDRDASETVTALRQADIPFRFEAGSGTIAVSATQLNAARLTLAGQGLPRAGETGFEMIQQDQGFGTSQFIENARYQHALETELARSVSSLQPVRSARVHLAIPKPSAFTRSGDTPSASVLVDLQPGRTLEQNQVASIVHMVASSVSGMTPSAVTVIDQFGRLLSNEDGDSSAARSAEQLDHVRRVESDYVRRINELLLPLVGVGRVSAQVAADIDFSETEEAREQYAPDPAKVRSEQVVEDTTRGAAPGGAGVPGATSNQPPQASANPPLNSVVAGSDADVQNQSRQTVRNYELDRTVSHTRQSTGKIRRLSVAVLLDHVPRPKAGSPGETELVALSDEELAKVNSLVREAVGFEEQRGDSVSIQNASFLQPEIAPMEPLPLWKQPEILSIARQIGGWLLAMLVVLFVLRPVLRAFLATPLRAMPQGGPMPEAIGVEPSARALAEDRVALAAPQHTMPVPQSGYEQKLQAARSAVAQDPKRVAQVVKTWVGQEA